MQQTDEEKLFDQMVEARARHWGIPKQYRRRQAVRDLVRFCHQLRLLQQEIDLRALSHHPDSWMSDEEIFRDRPTLWQKVKHALLHKGHLPAPILNPTLGERYRA